MEFQLPGSRLSEKQLKLASKRLNHIRPNISSELFTLDIFWCRFVFSKNANWNLTNHDHSFFELHIPLTGNAQYELQDISLTVDRSHSFLIGPECVHKITCFSDAYSEFVFGFAIQANSGIYSKLSSMEQTYFSLKTSSYIHSSIIYLLESIYEEKWGYYSIVCNQLNTILLDVFNSIFKNWEPATKLPVITDDVRIRIATKYVNDNIAKPISVTDIANAVHLSPRQFNRILNTALSMSTIEFINSLKIRAAKEYIRNANLSISEIAEQCGFSSLSHFSKTFKKIEKTSPQAFRKDLNK